MNASFFRYKMPDNRASAAGDQMLSYCPISLKGSSSFEFSLNLHFLRVCGEKKRIGAQR